MRISLSVFFTLHIVPDTVPGKLLPELVAEQYCLSVASAIIAMLPQFASQEPGAALSLRRPVSTEQVSRSEPGGDRSDTCCRLILSQGAELVILTEITDQSVLSSLTQTTSSSTLVTISSES